MLRIVQERQDGFTKFADTIKNEFSAEMNF